MRANPETRDLANPAAPGAHQGIPRGLHLSSSANAHEIVWRQGEVLDRLARSTRDLLNVIAAVSERGAGFKSLNDTWADTTTAHGRLMLTVLGGLAEFERELIRSRTGEGRKRAKARGVKFGRPRKMTPHQRQEAIQRLAAGETMADVARTYNVDATTIGRLAASSPFEQSAGAFQ
jgi:DNA invertase Pin-like site-specific DNA recombinase